MQYTHLGRTGLQVSRLVLGTMNFGPDTSEGTSHTIMDRALDLGINFFDTANIYGWRLGEGWTEQIIGRWLERTGRRDDIVLATKVYEPMGEGPNTRGLSALHIRRQVEDSLRRLRTDHIDLYQALYNLAERTAELEVLPAAREYGLAVIPWSPLYGGILGGILRKTHTGRASGSDLTAKRLAANRERVAAYELFCDEIGHHPADVALAWLLHQPGVTGPIIGPRTLDQLDRTLQALDLRLGASELARLDEIFPGPGPAPEAYAW
jgi:aryl-alcohol dehydrogenase-like predicted oxidoreductase